MIISINHIVSTIDLNYAPVLIRATAKTLLITFLLLLFCTSCSTLPHYGQPRFHENSISLAEVSQVSYRLLKKSDFKARQLPQEIRLWADRLNAHTSISIRTAGDVKFSVTSMHVNGTTNYVGSPQNLTFQAVMIPEQSWWNPKISSDKMSYVLQHEQIHFGLMEIAARRLNKKVAQSSQQLIVFENSPEKVRQTLQEKVNNLISGSKMQILREHTRFDEDTSGYYEPEIQQQWYEKVVKDLRSLEITAKE